MVSTPRQTSPFGVESKCEGTQEETQSMTITLELPPELEARFVTEAKVKGVSVADIVKAYLYHAPPQRSPKHLTAEEVDRGLEEAADLIPESIPPLSDEAMSRESIYTREDDWN